MDTAEFQALRKDVLVRIIALGGRMRELQGAIVLLRSVSDLAANVFAWACSELFTALPEDNNLRQTWDRVPPDPRFVAELLREKAMLEIAERELP